MSKSRSIIFYAWAWHLRGEAILREAVTAIHDNLTVDLVWLGLEIEAVESLAGDVGRGLEHARLFPLLAPSACP